MWRIHPFSQRNKITKRVVEGMGEVRGGWGVGGWRFEALRQEDRGVEKSWKSGVGNRNAIGALRTFC